MQNYIHLQFHCQFFLIADGLLYCMSEHTEGGDSSLAKSITPHLCIDISVHCLSINYSILRCKPASSYLLNILSLGNLCVTH